MSLSFSLLSCGLARERKISSSQEDQAKEKEIEFEGLLMPGLDNTRLFSQDLTLPTHNLGPGC